MNTDKKRIREAFSVTLNSAQTTSFDTIGGSKYNAKFYVNLKGISDDALRRCKAWDVTFALTSTQSSNFNNTHTYIVNSNFGTSNQSNTYDNTLGDGVLGQLQVINGSSGSVALLKSFPTDNEPLRLGPLNSVNSICINILLASNSTYSTLVDANNPNYVITLFFKEVMEE